MADKYIIQRRTASGLETVAELPALESGKVNIGLLPVVGESGAAIIERGENANGEYIRWADGTQVCKHGLTINFSVSITSGVNCSNVWSWTYPSSFVDIPSVSCGGWFIAGVGEGWVEVIPSMTAVGGCCWSTYTIHDSTCVVQLAAIGRWK